MEFFSHTMRMGSEFFSYIVLCCTQYTYIAHVDCCMHTK